MTKTRALVLDFDGTITTLDLGDEICERFADPAWRAIDAAWERRELSLHEAQRQMWAMLRARREQVAEYVSEIAVLRPGLGSLLERASAGGWTLVLASGGFDFYIREVLGDFLPAFDAVYCNTLRFEGDRARVGFPHLDELGCGLCAVCKGRVCDRLRESHEFVAFVGDGSSDLCAVSRADALFAVQGSKLARGCREAGRAVVELTSFEELLPYLAA